MESRVEIVWLCGGLTLDIKILMEYSGQGKCKEMKCFRDTAVRYKEQLRAWATSRNWQVVTYFDDNRLFIIERM